MSDAIGPALARRIRWRIAVPTIVFMFLSSLDRVNVSFAAGAMSRDLGFTPTEYGFGAGILFLGFLAGQYPSVLLMPRIGFPRWIALLGIVWGLTASAMAFVSTPHAFYALRVLLGAAEGGLAPGVVLYLSRFATRREHATTFTLPMVAIPLSIVLGGPISGWLLDMAPPFGLASWRWMFVAQGLPTVLAAIAAGFYFPDGLRDAAWIAPDERAVLEAQAAGRAGTVDRPDWGVLARPVVWLAALMWFCLLSGAYGIMFWLPQAMHQMAVSLTGFQLGLVNALPWIGNMAAMYLNATHSDRSGERLWHIAAPAMLSGAALMLAVLAGGGIASLLLLIVTAAGLGAAQGAFWALPMRVLDTRTAAVAVVAINMIGTAGGVIVPPMIGALRQASGGFVAPVAALAGIIALAAVLVPLVNRAAR